MTFPMKFRGSRRVPPAVAALALACGLAACGGAADEDSAAPATSADPARSAPLAMSAAAADPSVISVSGGTIKGSVASTYRAFFGIPYAAPPVGALRWKAPGAAPAWSGTRDATAARSVCPQGAFDASGNPVIRGSEDCLFVNVYTPAPVSPTARLPVMVWLHGGAYVAGAGSDYDATVLAKKANAIIVTLNYRLGALGYLAHPSLTAESRDNSGNYGLLDQQAAMKWVQANIAGFGGDTTKVALFGGSAGGASVWANVASPKAAGLFTRAIVQSGPDTNTPLANGEALGSTFAANIGCTGTGAAVAACLRAMPVAAVIGVQSALPPGPMGVTFQPATGGAVLPQSAKGAVTSGSFNKVAILQGTNHDEGRLFAALGFDLRGNPLTVASYTALVNQMFGPAAAPVLAQYPAASYASPSLAYAALVTDSSFSCAARTMNRLASARTPVFAYEFNDPNAPVNFAPFGLPPGTPAPFAMGSYHGAETAYIFRSPAASSFMTSAQLALSDQMIGYWSNFAATGLPVLPAVAWPPYASQFDMVQVLKPGGPGSTTQFAADHKCTFWAGFGV
ncbi:MAG: carboxylesterase family protein [Burkholderiales bacterium]|nr:carboxylesterase family protein [Burkholderiales bacterium]